MKTIAISNQKGGIGKSTIAVHLAFYLRTKGHTVLFIDLDPQANASKTILLGKENITSLNVPASDLFKINSLTLETKEPTLQLIAADPAMADIERASTEVLANFKNNINDIKGRWDYCIIDTPPNTRHKNVSSTNDSRLCAISY